MRRTLPFVGWLWACGPAPQLDTAQPEPGPEPCGPNAERGLEVGQCVLDFSLPDRLGQPFVLSRQRGKVALVDISAVW